MEMKTKHFALACAGYFALLGVLTCLAGCDGPDPVRAELEANVESERDLVLSSECDGACNSALCSSVADHRDAYAQAGQWCFKDCEDTHMQCLLDAADEYGWCGSCEHDAAECRTGCLGLIEECHAEWTNDTCAQGWDHWCHLAIASGGEDCEADCSAASLACLEDDATCGGDCFAAAVDCRRSCP